VTLKVLHPGSGRCFRPRNKTAPFAPAL